jgi:sugar diacid utilization regulator
MKHRDIPAMDKLTCTLGLSYSSNTSTSAVDHGGDVAAASVELYVHRTTLYYRLNQIAELAGVDLRSGPTRTNCRFPSG